MRYDSDVISKNIKKRQNIKKTIIIIIYLILIPVILFSLLLIILELGNSKELPSFFNFEMFIVTSDSMEPRLNVNDIVIVKKGFRNEEYKVGNIITYVRDDGETITHRIDKIVLSNLSNAYITKGDNTTQVDKSIVEYEQIIGKVILTMPKLGYLLFLLKNKLIFLLCVLFLIGIIFCDYSQRKKMVARKIDREKHEKKSKFYF